MLYINKLSKADAVPQKVWMTHLLTHEHYFVISLANITISCSSECSRINVFYKKIIIICRIMPRDHEAKSVIIWEDKTPSEDKYLCLLYVIYLFPQKFCVCSKDVFCIAICPEGCKCAKHKQRTPNKPILKNQINTELWFLIPASFPFLCLSTQVSSVISAQQNISSQT